MPSFRGGPDTKTRTTTLTVAVKCRRLNGTERGRDIVRVIHNKDLVVLDPDLSKDYLERIQNRTKEKNYSFDYAFGPECTNLDVYSRCISSSISGLVQGLNATVFAYGSTGSGKTYTMVGTKNDPGLMVLSLNTIFDFIRNDKSSEEFEVTCSYLEVYNEVIYDLLEKSSGHLELREDPVQGIVVAGLRCIKVHSADKIIELLNLGNSRRKTESTEANATSSRSHAVLEITVKRKHKNQVIRGKLALVDLAGSERASETNSGGQKLRDGANINRSLLALANCINALGKQQKGSCLCSLPKQDGLSGNSQTVMGATISPASSQYHHTVNTLKYADRAKEIKTHIQKNIGAVDTHVLDYQRMIDSLQLEVSRLKKELAEKESILSIRPADKAADDELSWLNVLSHEINENVQERINLQKALFELEETNLRNRTELQDLDEAIAKEQYINTDEAVADALRARRQVILDNIRDNDMAGLNYQKDIEANEKQRCQLQEMIDEAISNNGNKTYLRILSQYRLLGMTNTELQFEIAMRDRVIYNQREALRNMWNLLTDLGFDEKQILEIAAKQGIKVEEWTLVPNLGLADAKQSQNAHSTTSDHPLAGRSLIGQLTSNSSHIFPNYKERGLQTFSDGLCDMAQTPLREEHHSSLYFPSQDHSPSAYMTGRKSSQQWVGKKRNSSFYTKCGNILDPSCSSSDIRMQTSVYGESHMSNIANNMGRSYIAYNFVIGAYSYWGPKAGYNIYHMSNADILFGGITVVCGIVGTLCGGLIPDRINATISNAFKLLGGATFLGAIFCFSAFCLKSLYGFIALFAVGEILIFATQAPVNYVCLHCIKPDLRALSMAMSTVSIHVFGDVPSAPLVGVLQDHIHNWRKTTLILTSIFFLAAIIWFLGIFLDSEDKFSEDAENQVAAKANMKPLLGESRNDLSEE